jgi:hypothetical protein
MIRLVTVFLASLFFGVAAYAAAPLLASYTCNPASCSGSISGYSYRAYIFVDGICDNSQTPRVGVNIQAVECLYQAYTSVSGNGFAGFTPSLAGYINASTSSSTQFGQYDSTIEQDCSGNLSSTGDSFGEC